MNTHEGEAPLKIGAVTRLSGVSPRAIRHYERLGLLLPAKRTSGGYRIFHPDTVQRVLFIRQAQALGFSLEAIRSLLKAQRKGDPGCAQARIQLTQRVSELAQLLQSLHAQQTNLQVLEETCERCEDTCQLKAVIPGLDPPDLSK